MTDDQLPPISAEEIERVARDCGYADWGSALLLRRAAAQIRRMRAAIEGSEDESLRTSRVAEKASVATGAFHVEQFRAVYLAEFGYAPDAEEAAAMLGRFRRVVRLAGDGGGWMLLPNGWARYE